MKFQGIKWKNLFEKTKCTLRLTRWNEVFEVKTLLTAAQFFVYRCFFEIASSHFNVDEIKKPSEKWFKTVKQTPVAQRWSNFSVSHVWIYRKNLSHTHWITINVSIILYTIEQSSPSGSVDKFKSSRMALRIYKWKEFPRVAYRASKRSLREIILAYRSRRYVCIARNRTSPPPPLRPWPWAGEPSSRRWVENAGVLIPVVRDVEKNCFFRWAVSSSVESSCLGWKREVEIDKELV